MDRITVPQDEWDRLCQALPEANCELRLLARVIDDLRRRFEEEDREHLEEGNALAQAYEDQVARGIEKPRYRYIWEPERRIHCTELDLLRSYLSLVVEALDLKEGERSDRETEGKSANNGPTSPPRGDEKVPPTDRGTKAAHKGSKKRLKRGDASLKICAALRSLASEGKWNVPEEEIRVRAGVPKSTYYRVLKSDEQAKLAKEHYHHRRLGRGPLRADDM
jgi:hypothetical protein